MEGNLDFFNCSLLPCGAPNLHQRLVMSWPLSCLTWCNWALPPEKQRTDGAECVQEVCMWLVFADSPGPPRA